MKFTCLVAVVGLVGSAATADDIGVDFASMPAACKWHVEWSDGTRWEETFMGKTGDQFVVKTVLEDDPATLVRRSYYTMDGHILRSEFANGFWQTMEPHSCFTVLGKCEYRMKNAEGADWKIVSSVSKIGKNKYFSRSKAVGRREHWEETFVLGPFNLEMENRAGKDWTRINKLEGCGETTS